MIKSKGRSTTVGLLLAFLLVGVLVAAYYAYPWLSTRVGRIDRLGEWMRNPSAHSGWAITAGERCGEAPFISPTTGYVGFIWGGSFRPGHRHQGIDKFGGDPPGK